MPTLQELQDRKAAYLAAEKRILDSQDYTVGDGVVQRRNRRAELADVQRAIQELDAQIAALTPASAGGSGRRIYYGVPRR